MMTDVMLLDIANNKAAGWVINSIEMIDQSVCCLKTGVQTLILMATIMQCASYHGCFVEFNNFDTITVGADKNFQNSSYFGPSYGNLKKIIVS